MTDVHDTDTRRYNMSRIKGFDTKPEMLVRKFLHAKGLRFRLHNKKLLGKPDLTIAKYRTVIFVNGCFWHGHKDCKYFVIPKTRGDFWQKKIDDTRERDAIAICRLEKEGWRTLTVWECELKSKNRSVVLENIFQRVIK